MKIVDFVPFNQAFVTEPVGKLKIKESEYDPSGSIRVVDQGQKLISGRTNRFQPQEAKGVAVDYSPEKKHRVRRGDLIISRANTLELVGAVVRVSEDYPLRLLSDKTLRLVVDEKKIEPDYLLNVLQWPEARAHIEHNATGTSDSMRNISQKTICSIPVPLVSKDVQNDIIQKFDTIADELLKIEASVKKSLSDLCMLPQKILSQAFEGCNGG